MNEKTQGIILKQTDYKETDVLLSVLTEEYGVLTFTARGVRKQVSKNAGALFPLSLSEFLFDYKPSITMFTLHSASLCNSYRHAHESLEKTAVCGVLTELCELMGKELNPEDEVQKELFTLLNTSLAYLDQNDEPWLVLALFLANILEIVGIAPEVDECALCGKTQVTAISVDAGGFVCADCTNGMTEDVRFLKQFRLLNKAKSEHLPVLQQYGPYCFRQSEILYQFLSEYAGIQLKSWKFLREVATTASKNRE